MPGKTFSQFLKETAHLVIDADGHRLEINGKYIPLDMIEDIIPKRKYFLLFFQNKEKKPIKIKMDDKEYNRIQAILKDKQNSEFGAFTYKNRMQMPFSMQRPVSVDFGHGTGY